MYRKAALKIVQDIGEPALSEASAEIVPPATGAPAAAATTESSAAPIVEDKVEKQDGEATSSSSTATETATEEDRKTTTGVRKPLEIPSSVSVAITADNLLEYVGPPMYQKDRMYTKTSPVGVSCGLGYLGNGSGAVMPIEVTVRCSSSGSVMQGADSRPLLQSMPGSGIQLTGKLGEVIKESAQIALSFLKANAFSLGLTTDADHDLLYKRAIHLHMPYALSPPV